MFKKRELSRERLGLHIQTFSLAGLESSDKFPTKFQINCLVSFKVIRITSF